MGLISENNCISTKQAIKKLERRVILFEVRSHLKQRNKWKNRESRIYEFQVHKMCSYSQEGSINQKQKLIALGLQKQLKGL
jgi:hypothetical protein